MEKLKKVFNVSSKIQMLAQKKYSTTRLQQEEHEKNLVLLAREMRKERLSKLDSPHKFILEYAADFYGVDLDEIIAGVIDSDSHVTDLVKLLVADGLFCTFIYYGPKIGLPITSGRYDPKIRYTSINRAVVQGGYNVRLKDMWLVGYRKSNNDPVNIKTIHDEIAVFSFGGEGKEIALFAVKEHLMKVLTPALRAIEVFGLCSESQIVRFFHRVDMFNKFLESSNEEVENRVIFDVSNHLYKGFLLAKYQIEATAKDRNKVKEVEWYFDYWLRKIQVILNEGTQLEYDPPDVGPVQMLQRWRRKLTGYKSVTEFINTTAFQNHFTCLCLSRSSKLLKKWKLLHHEVTTSLNEASDNLRYMTSLQTFWDPLYMGTPRDVLFAIEALLVAIRSVSKSANYFNTCDNVTGLLVKITNQLTLSLRCYLTNNHKKSIWNIKSKTLIDNIETCKEVMEAYKKNFFKTIEEMKEAKEKPWVVSPVYIFCYLEKFSKRLDKIKNIAKNEIVYSILDRIRISGMEKFANAIKDARTQIDKKPYDPLNFHIETFNDDYITFMKAIEIEELKMQQFVKRQIEGFPLAESMLLVLKRFEKLNLDCLCMDRRYLDVAELLEKEIFMLKDIYNLQRRNPPIPRNAPPMGGRIVWIRMLHQRVDVPMQVIKTKPCVLGHEKAQRTVKFYNYMSGIVLHYEMMHQKAWFDYVEEVRPYLHMPVLKRDQHVALYRVNLHESVYRLMRETEYFWKLKIHVPGLANLVTYCKSQIMDAYTELQKFVKEYEQFRNSVCSTLVNIMRFLLKDLEIAIKPGTFYIKWTSEELGDFVSNITKKLNKVMEFYNNANSIQNTRVQRVMDSITETMLAYIPTSPVDPDDFLMEANRHRQKFEKEIEFKSQSAEKAVVEMINFFVDEIDFPPDIPSKGGIKRQFQLPLDMINDENWKRESRLPIDKYDWIQFDKIYRTIWFVPEESRVTVGIREYENFHYGLRELRNDCMDLFSHFNSKMISALVLSTKRSLDAFRKTLLNPSWKTLQLQPVITTIMELDIPYCTINPTLDQIQSSFQQVYLNAVEICYFVSTWGKQAKTPERRARRVTPDENRHERSFFKVVSEHKDVVRAIQNLSSGLSMFRYDIDQVLKQTYEKHQFIWADDREAQIKKFVENNPLIIEIREKFTDYDKMTNDLTMASPFINVGPIQIRLEKAINSFVEESKNWKLILGRILSVKYKAKLEEMTDFISEQLNVLGRQIKDLDDVRQAMNCLERIRDNQIEMEIGLYNTVEVYNLFNQFNIAVEQEDLDKVDMLQSTFNKMIEDSKNVSLRIIEMQGPLLSELNEGIKTFTKELAEFNAEYELKGPMVEGIPAKEASDRVYIFQSKFDELWRKFEMCSSGEKLFGLPVTDYPILHQRKREFGYLNKLYSLYIMVLKTIDEYMNIAWVNVDIEKITAELQDFQLRCRKLPKGMQTWPAFIDLKKKIDDFNETVPLLELMTNKAMKERHWTRINALLGTDFDPESSKFVLGLVLKAQILRFKDDVEDICVGAVKELDIEAKLNQVIQDWSQVHLQTASFKSRGELLLKGGETMDIITSLEDSVMVMNSLASNRYNAPFKKNIMVLLKKLVNTGEILERWLMVQNLWMYLEAVFVGGDIAKQLPLEAKRFSDIDKKYVKIMYRVREISNAVECCTGDEILAATLIYLTEQLEACQKSLTGYLEKKRLLFPRFFFVSDPVLLEILGQASDPTTIQPHLLSIFDAIATVDFQEGTKNVITAMNSSNGERVRLETSVQCQGGVEIWLGKLLKEMQDTIKNILAGVSTSLSDPNFNFLNEFPSYCGQAALVGIQILWTKDSETALRRSRIDRSIMKQTNQSFLNILNFLIELTIKDLTKLERIRYETMVTIHVHQRDIFDDLFRLKVRSTSDFEWQKQARFYFIENTEDVIVSITDVNFIYQNEYLGVTERLAITPLTDRCYITLAQAVGMCMGGAPAGPAGTGKTETTKDMGRALGKLVVVFNCSDQMDFRGLARIFKGLAQSGSWGCFDEFNRIELPVLSVAAQQIYIVLTARKERKTHFIFSDGDVVSLNPEFGLFITMNPGYAGRQELPENLKIQFRSVAMMVPDRQIIMRVKLASCGFKDNVPLSRKFFTLYKLCEEQLSKQVHYDFGLRNILSVLRTLGAQKRAAPGETEETILMRVLKDMNVSKLTDEDEPLFQSLIEDMFPGIKLTTSSYKELQKAIASSAAALGYVNSSEWNLKVVQLYESSLVRHGLMLMGPTGSGKTSCTQALLMAFTDMGKPHKEMRMNPKAITAPQMFGRLDVATNDWTDGIFSTLWRRSWKVKPGEHVWLVLDGPVDAVWIENLNSVLDDNKTLTLANGDRIKMAESCKLVFEPDNVDNASPATVSRVGMVYTSSSVVKWKVYLEAWFMRHPNEAEVLRRNFDSVYDDVNTFVQTKIVTKMKLLEAIYITQFLSILDGLLDGTTSEKYLDRIFVFCLMWSVGAVLEISERVKLEDFLTKHPSKLKIPKRDVNETIFEYYVEKPGQWVHWSNRVEKYDYPDDSIPEYAGILIPNVDNVRTAFLLHNIAKQRKGVLLIGEQGTAKTVMIKGYMLEYDPEEHMSKSFNFSSATTPNMYQKIIESYVEKRVGLTYGPPGQRRMTIFIDDINMPIINEWGDQITNEIVRQMIEQGGFYALDKPGDFYTIMDIQLLAAMIHPGGGRNDIPNRLKRQFCVFNCTLPSNNSMDQIFRSIGEGYFCLSRFNEDVVRCVPHLVPLTRIFWQNIKVKMLPTPANFHYVFNLRDLSRIWEGMLTIQGPECSDVATLIKLWRHECCRVIADRFTDIKDKNWFLTKMNQDALRHLGPYASAYDDTETYFVDFLRDPVDAADDDEDVSLEPPKIYEEIPSFEFVINKVLFYMRQFNEYVRGFSLDLVFFKDALCHLMIISRIIRTPRGNALLVGVGGSGKQSLTRLASFIAGYKFHQIVLTRAYNAGNLADDLKYLYRTAGLEGQGITFIFTDNEIKEEGFLEFINNVLSSGEIAGLFPKDEMDEIFSDIIPVMKKLAPKRPPTQDNLYDFFISRARFNLHVALCFSPIGDKFRARALKFPGLISGCTIDWFQKWSEDGRVAVSRHYLEDFDIVCDPLVKESLIEIMSFIHESVSKINFIYFEKFRRQFFVTPKTLISFLESYKLLYTDKRQNIVIMAERMSSGLSKLDEAAKSVSLLKVDLIEMNKQIEVANAAAEVVLNEVASKSAAAEIVKAQVLEVKSEAEALVVVISADKAVAEAKLEKARPALEEAEAALKTIKAADIATVRKLGKPPYLITLIMDCVIIYFGKHLDPVRPDMDKQFLVSSWTEALKVMADTRFLSKILEFPTDTINGEMIDLLTPYFIYPQYNLEAAKVACGNVAGLLSWTVAMAKYYEVNKEVLPLKANLAVQEAKYRKAAGELKAAEDLFAAKEAELAEVQKAFKVALEKKEAVQAEAKKVQDKTDAATALIDGLKDEKIRWTEQLAQFKNETDRLVGDVIYLTGFLSYTGPFNQEFRSILLSKWYTEVIERKIPISTNINIIDSLTDRTQIGEWNLQGLPTDDLSIQNGIIATKAFRYPLLIDPQSQGKIWIKNKEKINNLIVTSLNHKYFRNHIEDGVSMGFPILIEDVGEELDPCLDNVLDRNLLKVGTTYKIRVGDKEVDYNRDFRLYITTKLPNPSYTPEVCARAAIIDFTVTMKGLEDQLLGRVIVTERKELEDERTELVETVTGNLKLMKQLEANLLHKLSTTEGSLLDDVTVIQVLNTSKKTANEVKEKLAIAKVTEEKINNAREEYRPVATRGSVLYFLVTSMTMVNCMYQTSLVQFLERFDASMANSQKTHITQKRIRKIIKYLTYEIYRYKSRGLYETHKYLFVLLMALNIDIQQKVLSYDEFQNFIKGGAALNLKDCPPKPHKWITDETWLNIVQLSSLRQFSNLVTQIVENERGWRLWFNKARPESESIPDGYNNLDVFKKLLLIRAWCPDRTVAQSRAYISNSLGSQFVDPIILSYDDLLAESRPLTPLVCFLSMGSDPSPTIEVLAKKNETTVRAISMGQGQEIHARKLMLDCLENGGWVLLQNCHLGLEYMQELVLQLNELEKENTGFHENFRLWITTEVHIQFPITLLQISIKYTNEPPAGLRAGLKRTYGNLSQDFLDYSESPYYHPLVFGISFLHSVVQERRKFGPLGWNIPYEFNSADWLASCMFVQNHLDDMDPKRGISWVTVRYMLGEIQYGGRVTDDYDKRLLNTFARVWFSEAMFGQDFQFYHGYKMLRFKLQEDYLAAIEDMPGVDAPQALGFHPNADITYQTNAIKSILDTIVSIQPKESAGAGEMTREDKVAMQTKEMLNKMPPIYDLYDVKQRVNAMGALNSLNIFLRQEIDRMQKILVLVRATLRDLLLAIEGTIIMSDQLRDALDNIFNARVPKMWLRGSWVSSTLGFWYSELLERNLQFYNWCYHGRPIVFWMSGFFNPQGFLTAMKQEVARAHKGWALDQVSLQNDVLKQMSDEFKKPPKEGVFVHGLFLDGAGWDKKNSRLVEAANKVLYVLMPVIHIYALGSIVKRNPKLYECPVYKKINRTDLNFITPLWMDSLKPPDHWVLRGVALLGDIK